jgi:ribonuclease Z
LEHTTKTHLKKYTDDGKLGSSLCDLRDVKDIRSKVAEAAKFFDNKIDVLVNNARYANPPYELL